MTRLVLASTSRYRRALLERLGVAFEVHAPGVDEAPLEGERPEPMVRRLARAKAEAVAAHCPESLVVGSDQVASLGDDWLGKPGGEEANVRQLLRVSGRRVEFLTAVCLVNTARGSVREDLARYVVEFPHLDEARVRAYVAIERAFDCAGGFRAESLGPAIFERMEGDDPTALMGLPLIRLCRMLALEGLDVLSPATRA